MSTQENTGVDPGVPVGPLVRLRLQPITLAEANEFVRQKHRHHKPVPGAKFCLCVSDAETVRGVAIVGRPVARMLDDGWTLEVNRVATDGARNACSMLYGAAWRAAVALGYRRIVTYTLPEEGGASLRASGWEYMGDAGGGKWSRPSRKANDDHPLQIKNRWEKCIGLPDSPRLTVHEEQPKQHSLFAT